MEDGYGIVMGRLGAGGPSRARSAWAAGLVAVLLATTLTGTAPLASMVQDAARALSPKSAAPAPTTTEASAALASLPLRFEENLGQTDQRVRYLARMGGGTAFFTPDGVVFSLAGQRGQAEHAVVHLRPMGANPDPAITASEPQSGAANYLIGSDASTWVRGARGFSELTYAAVWEGIDLRFYQGPSGGIEYDTVVAPGADPSRARFEVAGAEGLSISKGALRIETASGPLNLTAPVAYQEIAGARRSVPVAFELQGSGFGFRLGEHDPRHTLVIDPEVLTASTYLGGGDFDGALGIALDADGRPHITGETESADFPVCLGANDPPGSGCTAAGFQTTHGGGFSDAFLTVLTPDGSALVASTYLGGGGTDVGFGIAVDADGRPHITGRTSSTNFPVCLGANDPPDSGCTVAGFQTTSGGGTDAFLTVLTPDASALVASTYLGGGSFDAGFGIAVDADGRAHITGETESADFPVCVGDNNPPGSGCTAAGFQTTSGGDADAFLTVLTPDGSALVASTYLGDVGIDRGHGIALDADGRAHITGETFSDNFPVCLGANLPPGSGCTTAGFQTDWGGGADAFLAVLTPDASALVASTYLGGGGIDVGRGIALDADGRPHITGETTSANFPVCLGADDPAGSGCTAAGFQTTREGPSDAFVARFDAVGAPVLACGDVVSGLVTLEEDLGPCPGDGLLVGAPDTIIDLGGHRITGTGGGTGIGVAPGANASGVVVKNGTLKGFGKGVFLRASGVVKVIRVRVVENASPGIRVEAGRAVVRESTALRNGGNGIIARADGRAVVTDNAARNNGGHGVIVRADGRAVVEDNTARSNGGHGIRPRGPKASIDDNAVRNNTRLGIKALDLPGVKGKNTANGNNGGKPRQCVPRRLC